MSLLDECIAAHGGRAAFDRLEAVDVRVRCSGLALAMKLRARALRDVAARVDLHEPSVTFEGLGDWDAGRPRPPRMPWRFPWRDQDVAYFAGYALWNYLAAPFIWSACTVTELDGRRLAITYPAGVTTHSREQVAYLDDEGRIARLDYTAEVFGPWARAQNVSLRYEWWAGILVPVSRRVTPRGLPRPTLVGIELAAQDPAVSSAGAVRYRSSR